MRASQAGIGWGNGLQKKTTTTRSGSPISEFSAGKLSECAHFILVCRRPRISFPPRSAEGVDVLDSHVSSSPPPSCTFSTPPLAYLSITFCTHCRCSTVTGASPLSCARSHPFREHTHAHAHAHTHALNTWYLVKPSSATVRAPQTPLTSRFTSPSRASALDWQAALPPSLHFISWPTLYLYPHTTRQRHT